jgi:hypothetical protein
MAWQYSHAAYKPESGMMVMPSIQKDKKSINFKLTMLFLFYIKANAWRNIAYLRP